MNTWPDRDRICISLGYIHYLQSVAFFLRQIMTKQICHINVNSLNRQERTINLQLSFIVAGVEANGFNRDNLV